MRKCICDNGLDVWNTPGAIQAFQVGQCSPCWIYWHVLSENTKQGGDGKVFAGGPAPWAKVQRTVAATAQSSSLSLRTVCQFLGEATGKTVACPSCERGLVKLKKQACSIHGECLPGRKVAGIAFCGDCSDYVPKETVGIESLPIVENPNNIVIDHGAGGIGDGLLGLCAIAKLKQDRPDLHVTYNASQLAVRATNSFVGLFNGPDFVGENLRCHSEAPVPQARQMNLNYSEELIHNGQLRNFISSFETQPRWERYAKNIGTTGYVIPKLKEPARIRDLGTDHAGCVVLCPKSTDKTREWGIQHWVTLESMLNRAGYQTTIMHSERSGIEGLKGVTVINEHAERIAGIMLNAACVIGTDHGLSHLGGILGVQTIVLGGGTPVEKIFGLYPKITCVQGPLSCSGCCGGLPADDSCRSFCANLHAITPKQIFGEVERVWLKETVAGGRSLLPTDRLQSIRDVVNETNVLAGAVAELGVYEGGSARLIRHFAGPEAPLHLFDTFCGIPEDDTVGIHKAGEFACDIESVREFVGPAEYHVGRFPVILPPEETRYRFVHVDADIYQSSKAACEYFGSRMVPGGVILWDDFGWKNCPGVAQALHEAFPGRVEHAAKHQARIRF